MAPDWVDVFPIKHGDIPASYVNLPEGNLYKGLFKCHECDASKYFLQIIAL